MPVQEELVESIEDAGFGGRLLGQGSERGPFHTEF